MEGTGKECTEEISTYIASSDAEVVKEIKNTIQENLYSTRGSSLLDILIEQYIQTKSPRLVELLVGINDSHSMRLFEKLNEYLKHGANFEVGTLLFCVVRKQPSWLHKIVGTPLFTALLKSLKAETDFILLMNGIVILATLLPCVPAILGSFLGDLFDVLIHGCCLLLKPGRMPEVCALHLHVGVYVFFQRLYSMYPNNLISFLRSFAVPTKGNIIFTKVIQPMFQFVKFHPDLVLHTAKTESSLEKWKVFQPHDVLAECQKISLDPVDYVKEGCQFELPADPVISLIDESGHFPFDVSNTSLLRLNSIFSEPDKSFGNTTFQKRGESKLGEVGKLLMYDTENICNPSEICAMTTPPSSRPISPSSSAHDLKHLGYDTEHSDIRGSLQSLNDSQSDRKSLSDSQNFGNKSPFSLHKTASSENVSQKGGLLKSLKSSTQSTPLSPRKSSGQKNLKNRPISSEFLKSRLGNSGQFDHYHSAPSSPMVPTNSTQFSFNTTPDLEEQRIQGIEDTGKPIQGNRSYTRCGSPELTNKYNVNLINSLKKLLYETSNKDVSHIESSISHTSQQLTQPTKSPMQVLDDYIQFGTELHSLLLSRVPLTSQLDTEWSHFSKPGQTTDEQKILQMQVHMLHTQLMYERYKTELHCLRNRRLFANLQRTYTTQTELDCLKNQLTLTERKLFETKPTLKAKNEEIRTLKTLYSSREQELNSKISELEEVGRAMQYKLKNTEATKQIELEKNKTLQKELNKVKNLLFEATEEIARFQPKMKNIEDLNNAVDNLQKQLAVQIQKHEKIKNSVKDFQVKNNADVMLKEKLRVTQHSYEHVKEEKDQLKRTVEALKIQIVEFENVSSKKDKMIGEHKEYVKELNHRHKKEIQVLKQRFDSCRKTCQSLQSYITSLYSKLECNEGRKIPSSASQISWNSHKCGEKCRTSVTYDDMDIALPSASAHGHRFHEHSHRHSLPHSSTSVKSRGQSYKENPFSNKTRANRLSIHNDSDSSSMSSDAQIN